MFDNLRVAREIRGRRVVVTGAGGFIGPVVVKTLLDNGAEVCALTGPPGRPARVLSGKQLTNIIAEITDVAAIRDLVRGANAVVHMAGPPSVALSFEDPHSCVTAHVVGTTAVLEACQHNGVGRLVYISSAEVYGLPDTDRVSEDHPLRPRSPYGAAKASAEHLVRVFGLISGMTGVILRPFSIYGPDASPFGVVGTIFRMAKTSHEIVLHDLAAIRDYCFVDDLARAVLTACVVDISGSETINIGSGEGVNAGAFADAVKKAWGLNIPVREKPSRDRPSSSNIHRLVADRRRAQRILEWEPSVGLIEGIRQCL